MMMKFTLPICTIALLALVGVSMDSVDIGKEMGDAIKKMSELDVKNYEEMFSSSAKGAKVVKNVAENIRATKKFKCLEADFLERIANVASKNGEEDSIGKGGIWRISSEEEKFVEPIKKQTNENIDFLKGFPQLKSIHDKLSRPTDAPYYSGLAACLVIQDKRGSNEKLDTVEQQAAFWEKNFKAGKNKKDEFIKASSAANTWCMNSTIIVMMNFMIIVTQMI